MKLIATSQALTFETSSAFLGWPTITTFPAKVTFLEHVQ